MFRIGLTILFLWGSVLFAGEPIPEDVESILVNRCLECHDAATEKGGINLDLVEIDWSREDDRKHWLKVFTVAEQNLMPPKDREPLSSSERSALLKYLDEKMLAHTPIGGGLPRRLTRGEYEATIRSLFAIPFEAPMGFPGDTEYHGFDNVAEGLVLSPAHLDAYSRVASGIADQIFPPSKEKAEVRTWTAKPEDLVLSFSAASVHGDALRLVSRSVDIMRSCTWPSRIEISDSGTYRISVEASTFLTEKGNPFAGPMILEVYARPVSATDRSKVSAFRLLREIEVGDEDAAITSFEADLYEGETVLFRWKNAEMTHDNPALREHFEQWIKKDSRFHAAWLKAVFPTGNPGQPRTTVLRGRNGWDIVSRHLSDPELDLGEVTMDSRLTGKFLDVAGSNQGTFNLADALCHFYHNHGPALEIHSLRIEGPSRRVESPADKRRQSLQDRITGGMKEGQSREEFAREMLASFLPRAFRRPVDDETIESYLTIVRRHWEQGHDLEAGMHLLIRSILISPRFLYRNIGEGPMDEFDLVTRLSYFLTRRPPDAKLVDLAARNRFSITEEGEDGEKKYWVIEREAERLMPKRHSDAMIQDFVGQWLETRTLHGIMPDPKFNFDEKSVATARLETERFFAEMLTQNLPMTDFIDPNFTFTTVSFAQRNYGFTPAFALKKGAKLTNGERTQFRRIEIERGGRYGGLLGQAAILMATANGVDTQPVIRGTWVLENIVGIHPPPPPQNIPALTPDTRGTTTPRELLTAHTSDANCAGCHAKIDPFGFALENYDPVGRWRKVWPEIEVPVDSSAVLFDGTEISGPVELKAWLVENIDLFSRCLAEKLMTYATGRVPNHTEKQEIARIVEANRERGNGFRDLVLALVASETFRTR